MSLPTRRKVVRLQQPVPPAPCREMPTTKDPFDALTRYHHWQDEQDKRRAQQANLDEALAGVVPVGADAALRPTDLLYSGRRDEMIRQWDQRWWTARLVELGHFAISDLLASLGHELSCRREHGGLASALARHLGRRVHTVIQERYRKARPGNRVSLDNRVHSAAGSEQLSRLAAKHPRSEYGTLNFALAGTRADIIDLTLREMWEIKPAALASEAVLQLWAYLDNHEIARVFTSLVEDGATVPPMEVGQPATLPGSVLEPIVIRLRGLPVPLSIQPYTLHRLPGLILYTVGIDRRGGRQAAAASIALGRRQLNSLMVTVGRTEAQRREAAIEAARMGQYVATGTVVVCAAVLTYGALTGPGAAAAGGADLVGGQVLRFTGRKVLDEGTREAAREVAKRAAGLVIVTTASGQFQLPPEVVGPTLDGGARSGVHLAPSLP